MSNVASIRQKRPSAPPKRLRSVGVPPPSALFEATADALGAPALAPAPAYNDDEPYDDDDHNAMHRAHRYVAEALDDLDRLVGVAIGVIDDEGCVPSEDDAKRVRRIAAAMRDRLLGAAAELK